MKLSLKLDEMFIAELETRRQSSVLQLPKEPGTGSSFIENFGHLLITLFKLFVCFQLKWSCVCNRKLSC